MKYVFICIIHPFNTFSNSLTKKWNIYNKTYKYRWYFRLQSHQTTSLRVPTWLVWNPSVNKIFNTWIPIIIKFNRPLLCFINCQNQMMFPLFFSPSPYFQAGNCFICGRRSVAVARYRMIFLVLYHTILLQQVKMKTSFMLSTTLNSYLKCVTVVYYVVCNER